MLGGGVEGADGGVADGGGAADVGGDEVMGLSGCCD